MYPLGFLFVLCVSCVLCVPSFAQKQPTPGESARTVVVAVRQEAERNARQTRCRRLEGDALTEAYVRAAATAARKLPPADAAPAFLIGVGIALDDSTLLRSNPLTEKLCKLAENEDERRQRLAALGRPTLRGRRDLCQHFVVSCALTEVVGATLAESAGLLKELKDARGGSGFSFLDLTANLSGIDLAVRLKKGDLTLTALEKEFRATRYLPDLTGLVEDLQADAFQRKYGSPDDARFKAEMDRIRERIRALARKAE